MSLEQPAVFPPRRPWPDDFPPVAIHADESRVKQHPAYPAVKSGDADAALQLVQDTLALSAVESLRGLLGTARPVLVSAHALEQVGVNAIPEALADELGQLLDLPVGRWFVPVGASGRVCRGYPAWSRLCVGR